MGDEGLPTDTEGNATVDIPVAELSTALSVTADTVALNTPNGLYYTLNFDGATLTPGE